ncbi:diguanylate cyclase [Paenibacillus sp. SI8]|uniref:sensor domain-containing diguanylate cyclase n=1 Tax=unclassified Paenibacillus TaxID=185978 RepID=UPI00346589E8
MLTLLFYFLGEYVKTALFPQYEMQIVLYWNAPMLLLTISILVHLSVLVAGITSVRMKRVVFLVYATPLISLATMLLIYGPQALYHPRVDGPSPLNPVMLVLAILFVGSYLLLSVFILFIAWCTTTHLKRKKMLVRLLSSLLILFVWILMVTSMLYLRITTSSASMAFYFSGTLLWVVTLRRLISKYDFLPSYRDLFHTLFKSAPTAIFLLDMQGNIKEMNPRAASLIGKTEGIDRINVIEYLFFEDNTRLMDRWNEYRTKRDNEMNGEMSWRVQNQVQLDMIVSMEVIEGAEEEGLLVLHLTDITSLKATERRLVESESNYRYLAYHDPLTGLFNRAAFQEHVNSKIAEGVQFALILIDLDNFKSVNDTHGHLIGDEYLKHIAALMKLNTQSEDILGRIGGDEFVMLIPLREDEKQVYQDAHHRLSSLTANPYPYGDDVIPVSFSAGVSIHPRHASEITTLLQKADEAMYAVKRNGKNAISIYSQVEMK